MRSSASSLFIALRLLAETLHTTIATAAIRMAPPTPTTTPIMIFLSEEERPELDFLDPSEFKPGASVAAAAGWVVVMVIGTVLPLMVLTVVITETTGLAVVVGTVVVVWAEESPFEVDVACAVVCAAVGIVVDVTSSDDEVVVGSAEEVVTGASVVLVEDDDDEDVEDVDVDEDVDDVDSVEEDDDEDEVEVGAGASEVGWSAVVGAAAVGRLDGSTLLSPETTAANRNARQKRKNERRETRMLARGVHQIDLKRRAPAAAVLGI